MQTLTGISKYSGIAMAVGVVIDAQSGLSGLPSNVIKDGLKALRFNLPDTEKPEIIVICDMLGLGSAIKIPGVKTIGIASKLNDEPALPLSVPCVAGVEGLFESVSNGDFIIVDADQGVIHIDPDIQTIISYQNMMKPEPPKRLSLDLAETLTTTSDGRVITVAAAVSSIGDAAEAISNGADVLVVYIDDILAASESNGIEYAADSIAEALEVIFAMAPDMQTVLVISDPNDEDLISSVSLLNHRADTRIALRSDCAIAANSSEAADLVRSGVGMVIVKPHLVDEVKGLISEL